jgi:3D (Asp-Asp-Asp) domain-containing protein
MRLRENLRQWVSRCHTKRMALYIFGVIMVGILLGVSALFILSNREYKITAYCSCSRCCKKNDSITASGHKARVGYCASKSLPFGTVIDIQGVGRYIVMDRGLKENYHLDIWYPTHRQAQNFGVRYCKIKRSWR